MKTIVCEQPNKLKLIETEAPSLKEGEALVRVKRIGICGTDLHAYKGNQPYFTYPRVLGHELTGIIETVAANEDGFEAGEQVSIIPYMECGECIACRNGKTNCCTDMRVFGVHMDGGMQEIITVPTSHLIKTEGLTLDQSVILEPMSIGAHAVRRSELKQGETALVIGAGPIGLGVMAFAKQRGARVIAADINDERLRFCKEWANVDETVNVLHQPKETLAKLTDGEFPTVVFDATGNVKSMMDAIEYTAHGGKLIYVGLAKGNITFADPEFHKRELTLMGSRNATKEDFSVVMQAVKSGFISVERYITHRVGFERMIENYDQWTLPESRVIKAVVEL